MKRLVLSAVAIALTEVALSSAMLPTELAAKARPAARAELVRQVMSSPDDGDAWSALQTEATEAADGPFLLRELRFEAAEATLALDLGGYGLPTLEQSMKTGDRTRIVVTLTGARSALPHGFAVEAGDQFGDVRVRHAPYGIEVEATLPEGVAAVFDETAEGVRIRAIDGAAATVAAGPAAGVVAAPESRFVADEISMVLQVAQAWLVSLRAGRPLALFPVIGMGALLLLIGSWFIVRRRSPVPTRRGASDAQRLADRLLSQAH